MSKRYLPESTTLVEKKLYDVEAENPVAQTNNKGYGKNKHFLGKNGHDKPLNNMSMPYGAYSVARKAYSNGRIAVDALAK